MIQNKMILTPSERIWRVVHWLLAVLVLLFLIVPVLVIVPLSFNDSSFLVYPLSGFSLRWYANFFQSPEWMLGLKNTLIVAPLATVIATVLGTAAALALYRARFPGKGLLLGLLISPMVVPVVILGVAAYLFFAPLGLANNLGLLVVMHAVLGAPFVLITVMATLEGYDTNLGKAAASLGAPPLYVFHKVTLPLIAPGVISGALFAFGTSFDEAVMTLFIAGPDQYTLPRVMFSGIRENLNPTIAAAASLLILFSVAMLLTLEWLRRRAERLRLAVPQA